MCKLSVHHVSFVQTIIYNFRNMTACTYSVLHPMKYVENDVMLYKACMTLTQGFITKATVTNMIIGPISISVWRLLWYWTFSNPRTLLALHMCNHFLTVTTDEYTDQSDVTYWPIRCDLGLESHCVHITKFWKTDCAKHRHLYTAFMTASFHWITASTNQMRAYSTC